MYYVPIVDKAGRVLISTNVPIVDKAGRVLPVLTYL